MTQSMDFDDLGNRMKRYEQAEAGRQLMPGLPVIARLDGHAFHTFTKGLKRPYDVRLSMAMIDTTIHLVDRYQADWGYTQSDEITLVFRPKEYEEFPMFSGKYQKMVSLMASTASVKFNECVAASIPEKANESPEFDCRIWNVPDLNEVAECLRWRQMDAIKNSVSMAASSVFTDKELHGVNTKTRKAMLHSKGIIWDDYPEFFKQGTFVTRFVKMIPLDEETRMKIPEKHRPSADATFERRIVNTKSLPRLNSIMNPAGILFHGEAPQFVM